MDTQFLSFVIPTLIATWGITKGDAGLIGTVTLLTSALGGWLAGILSDRIGRVKTLQMTILWFAFFTVLCGLAQNFDQLLLARGLMGFGMGGEWTAGAILIGEVIRAKDRGKAVGMVQAGWAHRLGRVGAAVRADVLAAAAGMGVAFAVPAGRVAGDVRDLHPPLRRRAGSVRRQPSARQESSAENGHVHRDLLAQDAQHHLARRAAHHRRPGRLLRHHHLAADLPENRTPPDRAGHRRLPGDGHRRLVCRLHRQRLPHRLAGPQEELHPVRRRFAVHRAGLHPHAGDRLA